MSTSVGERAPGLGEEPPPDWSSVPEPTTGGDRPVLARVGLRVAAAGLAALVLWWLGHRLAVALLLTVIALVTAASLLFPSFARRLERAEWVVRRVAGRALSLVLLGAVQLLVFTPLSLLLRLVGHDPLALRSTPADATFWRPIPRRPGRPLYRRPFTYERLPRASTPHRLPLPRLRAAVGLVALVALLDVGVGAVIATFTGELPLGRTGGLAAPDVAAGRGEPWRDGLGEELAGVGEQRSYDPYLGWTLSDFDGRYVNVGDGARRSYQPAGSERGDAIEVSFFGGSTMFGVYQRDEHTIPSEFARLAEADGIRLRVANHGVMAYTNWQEMLTFERLVSGGSAPDLAVFYDGFNELLEQFSQGPHTEPRPIAAADLEARFRRGEGGPQGRARAFYDSWARASAVHRLARALGLAEQPVPDQGEWGEQGNRAGEYGRNVAAIHARGVDVSRRLADSYGSRVAFFWQPFLYNKRLVPGEEELVGRRATDSVAWTAADRVARSRLEPPVVDVSDALDGVDGPVMYDVVHTNERGARVVARTLYEELRPELRELSRR